MTKLIKPLDIILTGHESLDDLLNGKGLEEKYTIQDAGKLLDLVDKAHNLNTNGMVVELDVFVNPDSVLEDSLNSFAKQGLKLFPQMYLTVFTYLASRKNFASAYGSTAEEVAINLNQKISRVSSFKSKATIRTMNTWICPKCKLKCEVQAGDELICKSCLTEVEPE